jgi:hypothetical protein
MKRAITESARSATAVEKVAQHLESSICTAIEQSKSLESTVRETARFASAMERAAEHIAASSEVARASVNSINQQMRAYLVVDIGSAVYQDRANNKKFPSNSFDSQCWSHPRSQGFVYRPCSNIAQSLAR